MKFKSKYFVFVCIICILFSIAAVSANDNQTDALNLNPTDEIAINDNDKLMDVANKSYDDFYDDIKDCTDTFNIKNNYVYRESDNRTQLIFNQSKIVIN